MAGAGRKVRRRLARAVGKASRRGSAPRSALVRPGLNRPLTTIGEGPGTQGNPWRDIALRDDRNKPDTVKLDAHVRRVLGEHLRAVYTLVEEPIPPEHIELLLALRRKERERSRVARAA